jgi:DNA-binding beta-propeller fold protein YncE
VLLGSLAAAPAHARDSTAVGSDPGDAPRRASAPAAPPESLVVERIFGRFGVGPGELTAPEAVTVDARGRILVADTGNHRIVRFDSTGTYLDQFGGFGHEDGRFDRPTGVFTGGTLGIWVLDRGNARIVRFDLEGRPVGVVVDLQSDPLRERLGTVEPGGFSADAGGRLVLTDVASDRVIEFDPLGAVLTVRGEFGTQPGRFHDPAGVAVDARGGAWIADAGNRRVQRLDALGAFVEALPLAAGMRGKGGLAVAVSPLGELAVADAGTGILTLQDARGRLLARHQPAGRDGLWAAGVAFDAAGRLLVADPRHHHVVRLRRAAAAP